MNDLKKNKIILLADDDEDDRELFDETLKRIGSDTQLYTSENGSELLVKLKELHCLPDLIFLDINMPVMSGWACLKAIKTEEKYKDIPVIMYSSSTHQREKEIALELGAVFFFTKPDNFSEFTEKLKLVLSQY